MDGPPLHSQRSLKAGDVQEHLRLRRSQWLALKASAFDCRNLRHGSSAWSTIPYEDKRALCQELRSLDKTGFKDLLARMETEENPWCSWYLLANASGRSFSLDPMRASDLFQGHKQMRRCRGRRQLHRRVRRRCRASLRRQIPNGRRRRESEEMDRRPRLARQHDYTTIQ